MFISFTFTKKHILIFSLFVICIFVLAVTVFSESPRTLKDRNDRIGYLTELGYSPDPYSEEYETFTLPDEFSETLKNYDELERRDGFCLYDYRGLRLEKYSYSLTGYDNVKAVMYIYENQLIGGDVHSVSLDGEMLPLISGADYEFNQN